MSDPRPDEPSRKRRYIGRPAGLSAPGSYSHVSVAGPGRIVHLAGQVGLMENGELGGDGSLGAQVRQAYRNVGLALEAAGATYDDVVKTTIYLVGEEGLEELKQARAAVLAEIYPSGAFPPNTLLLVARLADPQLVVEIDAIAVLDGAEVADV